MVQIYHQNTVRVSSFASSAYCEMKHIALLLIFCYLPWYLVFRRIFVYCVCCFVCVVGDLSEMGDVADVNAL